MRQTALCLFGFHLLSAAGSVPAVRAEAPPASEEVLPWATAGTQPALYGLLLPLSGPLQPLGERALRGALLASRLFSKGDAPPTRLAVADSAGEPAVAAEALRDLAARGVLGVVGPLKGSEAVEAARVGREVGVPILCPTPAADAAGGGAFRLYLREEDEVARLAEYAVKERGLARFAILYPDTALGRRYRDLFWTEAIRQGGEVTAVEAFDAAARPPSEAIQRLTGVFGLTPSEIRERFLEEERVRLRREKDLLRALDADRPPGEEAAGAPGGGDAPEEEIAVDPERLARYRPEPIVDFDAVFLPASGIEAAQVAPQMAFHDVERVVLLGLRSWNYPAFVAVGEEYVSGALFASELDPALPEARRFAEAYRAQYGEEPGVIEAYAYDAVGLMVSGEPGLGADTRASVRARLAALWSAAAVTGPLTAHPGGDIAATPKILTVRGKRIVPAE